MDLNYHSMESLLKAAKENMPEETLLQEATRWEMRHGGVSGRTAQQFINYLAGTQTAGETP